MPERHKGYVVGRDETSEGQKIWKVRVKDPASPHNKQKLIVASVHDQLELAQGLNVNFAIGTIDDKDGNKVSRAVDVRLEPPGAQL